MHRPFSSHEQTSNLAEWALLVWIIKVSPAHRHLMTERRARTYTRLMAGTRLGRRNTPLGTAYPQVGPAGSSYRVSVQIARPSAYVMAKGAFGSGSEKSKSKHGQERNTSPADAGRHHNCLSTTTTWQPGSLVQVPSLPLWPLRSTAQR